LHRLRRPQAQVLEDVSNEADRRLAALSRESDEDPPASAWNAGEAPALQVQPYQAAAFIVSKTPAVLFKKTPVRIRI